MEGHGALNPGLYNSKAHGLGGPVHTTRTQSRAVIIEVSLAPSQALSWESSQGFLRAILALFFEIAFRTPGTFFYIYQWDTSSSFECGFEFGYNHVVIKELFELGKPVWVENEVWRMP